MVVCSRVLLDGVRCMVGAVVAVLLLVLVMGGGGLLGWCRGCSAAFTWARRHKGAARVAGQPTVQQR